MSTCVEISRDVVEDVRRPELVADYNGGDYTPTRAFLRVINAAHRHLDRRCSHENREYVYRIPIGVGQFAVNTPDELKYITRIDLDDGSDNTIVPFEGLSRVEHSFLRDLYAKRFSTVDTGSPVYWCRNEISQVVSVLRNPDFATAIAPWTIRLFGTLAFDAGTAELTTAADPDLLLSDGAQMMYTFDAPLDLRFFTFGFDVTAISGAGITLRVGVMSDDVMTNVTLTSSATVAAFTNTLSDIFSDTILSSAQAIEVRIVAAAGASINVDNMNLYERADEQGSLIVMPPADKTYTLVINYGAYALEMASNSDTTRWSRKNPDILVLAIKRQIEIDMNRNSTGVKDYDEALEVALFDVETDNGMEETSGRRVEQRFGWHP